MGAPHGCRCEACNPIALASEPERLGHLALRWSVAVDCDGKDYQSRLAKVFLDGVEQLHAIEARPGAHGYVIRFCTTPEVGDGGVHICRVSIDARERDIQRWAGTMPSADDDEALLKWSREVTIARQRGLIASIAPCYEKVFGVVRTELGGCV